MQIPELYAARMRDLLGDEYPDYLAVLDQDRVSSLRVNTSRWTVEEALSALDLEDERVPWVSEGVYFSEERRPARTPAWHGGLIYIQEASAMTPGDILPVHKGDRVLDLCAAPGGKATQISARLGDSGVLYTNDISVSRARILLKNLEMSGTGRLFVTAEDPARLAERLPEYFDSILTDVPCSGEGMIRKDSAMFRDWLDKGPSYYQPIQAGILDQAVSMLKPGGYLLYSTCTFSREEDEGNIESFLDRHPEMCLEPIPMRPGFSEGFLPGTVRLWPHRVKGEGHFLALMRKKGGQIARTETLSDPMGIQTESAEVVRRYGSSDPGASDETVKKSGSGKKRPSARTGKIQGGRKGRAAAEVTAVPGSCIPKEYLPEDCRLISREEKTYAVPANEPVFSGIRYLRTGLLLGEEKMGRFHPSQALAMTLNRPGSETENRTVFPMDDPRIIRYLKGETVTAEQSECFGEDGYTLVCADRYPLGWAVRKNGTLKNKYAPGWRMM